MAPAASAQVLLSPAELSYLHSSLSLNPPIRPDGRTPTQFRPLVAETDILPSANGSARVCFADGTEAIVGVKAEVEKSDPRPTVGESGLHMSVQPSGMELNEDEEGNDMSKGPGESSWVEMSIEVPGYRDDDTLPIFLSAMLTEALLASGELKDRLWINQRFHWKLYIDILLLSAPNSYPLPLLSITTHLALLSARLPKLVSEGDEDPMFNDDWEASTYLYPLDSSNSRRDRPPITLLVITVGANVIFDPSKEELAVAEAVVATSVGFLNDGIGKASILTMRTIDPPSRLTPPGIPNSINTVTGAATITHEEAIAAREGAGEQGVWAPPRGGLKRGLTGIIIKAIIGRGGMAQEVMDGLNAVQT